MDNTQKKVKAEATKNAGKLKLPAIGFFESWHLWLIIIGLAIFIVTAGLCLALAHKGVLTAVIIAIVVVAIYAIVIGSVLLFRYLVKNNVLKSLSKRAEGSMSVDSIDVDAQKRKAFDYYLKRKLHIRRFFPLSLQHSLHAKSIYLAVSVAESVSDQFVEMGWELLDNPEGFSTQVLVRKKQVIVLLGQDDIELKLCLSFLKGYSLFKPLAGIVCLVDSRKMQEISLARQEKEVLLQQLNKIQKVSVFASYKPALWLSSLSSLPGVNEIDRLLHGDQLGRKDQLSQLLQYLSLHSEESMYAYPDARGNAKAYLLYETLTGIEKQLSDSGLSKVCADRVFLNWKGQSDLLAKRLNKLPRLQLTWRYVAALTGTAICAVGLLAIFQKSFVNQSDYVSLVNEQATHPRHVTIRESAKLLLGPPALQVYPFSAQENRLDLTVLIAQGGKKFTQALHQELYQLLVQAVKSDNHKIDQALNAYLMLSRPSDYAGAEMLAWLKANQNKTGIRHFLTPLSQRLLLGLNETNFAALSLGKVSLMPTKKVTEWGIMFDSKEGVWHYNLTTTAQTGERLQKVLQKRGVA